MIGRMAKAPSRPSRAKLNPVPIPGEALLLVPGPEPMVVAADVHVGLVPGTGYELGGGVGDGATLARSLLKALDSVKSSHLLLLGDVKEPILGARWRVRKELREFFGVLADARVTVDVVKGNHDVGIEGAVGAGVTIHPPSGMLQDGIGYFHGHAWPDGRILGEARVLVAGHLHPGVRLAEGKRRCWVRVTYVEGKDSTRPGPNVRSLVVVPAYNPMCSCESLNVEKPRRSRSFLVRRFLSAGNSRAYLLDGTDVGPLRL